MGAISYKLKRGSRQLLLAVACLASGVAAAASCTGADAEALAWLDKMSRSVNQVSYHGVVTFQRGDDMQAMQISHSVTDGLVSERLIELTGQGAEVLRVDHPLECVHPGHRLLRIGAELQSGECGLASYYRFRVSDGELVAGRQAVQVHIEPRDMYRYGYRMELDRETGLLLKSQTMGRGGKVLEKFQFASLSYAQDEAATEETRLVHVARHTHPAPEQAAAAPAAQWNVGWLPLGFTLTDLPQATSGRRTYTDGLAVFSVFLEPLGQDIRPGEGVVSSGGTTSYTRGMHLGGQPVLVTVIGEVPLNTARMVADSIESGTDMLVETGRVVAVEADALWVETIRRSTCGGCAARQGCGHGLLNRIGDGRSGYIRVLRGPSTQRDSCQVNDQVRISIPEQVILRGSAVVYLLPLLCMLATAGLAEQVLPAPPQAGAAIGALLGLALGFGLVRWHAWRHRHDRRLQPTLLEVLPRAVAVAGPR